MGIRLATSRTRGAASAKAHAANTGQPLDAVTALLTSSPQGACDYIDADLREPEKILSEAARTLSDAATS